LGEAGSNTSSNPHQQSKPKSTFKKSMNIADNSRDTARLTGEGPALSEPLCQWGANALRGAGC
jgi:hypothetical protein